MATPGNEYRELCLGCCQLGVCVCVSACQKYGNWAICISSLVQKVNHSVAFVNFRVHPFCYSFSSCSPKTFKLLLSALQFQGRLSHAMPPSHTSKVHANFLKLHYSVPSSNKAEVLWSEGNQRSVINSLHMKTYIAVAINQRFASY